MQGLAAADFLTAFSSYGLEPLFQSNYMCEVIEDSKQHNDKILQACYLPYPECVVATHMSILSVTFHTASYMITTCLGIQKVIAIRFPIWTKCKLSNRKSIICCVSCFVLSLAFSLPRHVAVDYEPFEYLNRFRASNNLLPCNADVYHIHHLQIRLQQIKNPDDTTKSTGKKIDHYGGHRSGCVSDIRSSKSDYIRLVLCEIHR
ncbi:unnamed protein product [Mytilus edulis]|uniref:Uncharacterized protein n=1 Tax=Mytilus edulis TaxID=6550 RepID=A0A8S3T7J0_MYTED|nr:unnamed protein product [Mytilus edulis]